MTDRSALPDDFDPVDGPPFWDELPAGVVLLAVALAIFAPFVAALVFAA